MLGEMSQQFRDNYNSAFHYAARAHSASQAEHSVIVCNVSPSSSSLKHLFPPKKRKKVFLKIPFCFTISLGGKQSGPG